MNMCYSVCQCVCQCYAFVCVIHISRGGVTRHIGLEGKRLSEGWALHNQQHRTLPLIKV